MRSSTPDPVRVAIGRYGDAIRRGRPADEVDTLHTELKTAQLRRAIQEAVDSAPPLTSEQRAELITLLRAGGAR